MNVLSGGVLSSMLAFGMPAFGRSVETLSRGEMIQRLDELQPASFAGAASELPVGFWGACTVSDLTLPVGDPLSGEIVNVTVSLVLPRSQSAVPLVFVLPTIEGVTILEHSLSGKFCDLGMATLIANVNDMTMPTQMPSWGIEDRNDRRAILMIRALLAYARANPRFDRDRIVLLGNSLGAITASFLAGVEPNRFAAFVLTAAGGNIPYILSHSEDGPIVELRERRMENQHLATVEDYEDRLHQTMRYDPIHFASNANRAKIFMALSGSDNKVPSESQLALLNAFGRPEHTVFSVGHIATIAEMTYIYFHMISGFLSRALALPQLNTQTDDRDARLAPEIGSVHPSRDRWFSLSPAR